MTETTTQFADATSELAIPDSDGTLSVWSGTPSEDSMAMLKRHVDAMKLAFELAEPLVKTELVPMRFRRKPEDATAAILYGAELGLNPIQSLQRIIVIHGTPTIEARTMVALLKQHGYQIRTEATSDASVTVMGIGPDGQAEASTWTTERAIQAGYVPTPSKPDSLKRPTVEGDWVTVTKTYDGKSKTSIVGNMKYITDPQAMLYAKAAAEVCRKLAPDVLLGIAYTREDMESEGAFEEAQTPWRRDRVHAERPSRGSLRDRSKTAPADEPVDAETVDVPAEPGQGGGNDVGEGAELSSGANSETPPRDQGPTGAMSEAARRKWLNRMFALFGEVACTDRDEQIAVEKSISGREVLEHRDDLTDDELRIVVNQLNVWDKTGAIGAELTKILGPPPADAEEPAAETPVEDPS